MEKGFIDPKLQAQHRVPPGSNGSARPEDENHRDVFEDWGSRGDDRLVPNHSQFEASLLQKEHVGLISHQIDWTDVVYNLRKVESVASPMH